MEDRGYILRKGTRKILETINDCAVRFYEQNDVVIARYELIDKLELSIKILKSGDFSKKSLIDELIRLSAPEIWKDFMFLKTYNNAQLIWENRVNILQNDLDNEDDEYTQLCLIDDINRYKKSLSTINEIIQLANEFKALMLLAIPDLEAVFAKLLQEHEDLQAKHQNEVLEREKRRAEKISIMQKGSPDKPKDFSGLLKELTPLYIKDCSTADLHSIIIDKKLPLGRNRINWTGKKADAIRFIEHFIISKKQFNDMFILEDNKPLLAGNKDKNGTPSDLTDILQKAQN